VAFDAAPAHHDPTGVGVYVRDLAMALLERDPDSIALIGVRPDGPLAGAAAGALRSTFLRAGRHQRWLMTRARGDAAAVDSDLVHFTNAAAPLRPGRPFVLTIQDLSLLRYPHYHPPLRVAVAPLMVMAARRAKAVIVPSEATRVELRRLLHVSGRRVVVVPHAASTHVHLDPRHGPTAIGTLRSEMGIGDDPYLLSVSTLEPRKNHAGLVRAFEILTNRHPALRLVLVGDPGWRGQDLRRSLLKSPAADRIHVAGYVSPDRLSALIAGATVFAYVSLYEGFGLPILDAMRAGVPVVTSSVSSMPEVAGDAAVLVDPRDPAAIAAGLERAIAQRATLVSAGLKRSSLRCWSDVAGETWDVYRWAARQDRAV
jgi:glycosyltransferase involved in cell wall biosynthesis